MMRSPEYDRGQLQSQHKPPTPAELRRGEEFLAPTPGRPKLTLLDFKSITKAALRGFATVRLPNGLKISDISVLTSHGKSWAALPAKPQIDRDGQARRDANGKIAYSPILQWDSRELTDGFSEAVIALIRAEHPGALDDGPAS